MTEKVTNDLVLLSQINLCPTKHTKNAKGSGTIRVVRWPFLEGFEEIWPSRTSFFEIHQHDLEHGIQGESTAIFIPIKMFFSADSVAPC